MTTPTADRHFLQRGDECVYALHFGKTHTASVPGATWEAIDAAGAPVPAHGTEGGTYQARYLLVVTERPATAVVFTGPQPQRTIGYRLRDPDLESAALPFEVTAEQYEQLPTSDDIAVSRYRYVSLTEADPDERPAVVTVGLTGCQPIAVEWSESPEIPDGLTWVPSPAHTALWGPALAPHLVPGQLTGVCNAVLDRVAAHPWVRPWVTPPYNRHALLDHRGEVSLHFDRRFEGDPVEVVEVKLPGRSRKKVARSRPKVASEWVHGVKAPADEIPGVNLADALARLDGVIDAELDRILPPDGHVCGHCAGAGYIITETTP